VFEKLVDRITAPNGLEQAWKDFETIMALGFESTKWRTENEYSKER
jgi:hypothetical protein